jgi:ketosteroid isomerase-like protein
MRTTGKSKREPTRETEAIIQRYYKAFNAGDASGMLACLADDVRHDVNQGGARVGKKLFT